MRNEMTDVLLDWLPPERRVMLFSVLAGVSVVTLLASLILIPVLIALMPTDYFQKVHPRTDAWYHRHAGTRWTLLILKNLLGGLLLAGGLLMLVLPGQGLLTIFTGLMLMNYPGKRRLERFLVSRGPVRSGINWLRTKADRPPLDL